MAKRRRSFSRAVGNRPYRPLFVIATEGKITEAQYFKNFTHLNISIQMKVLHSKNNHGAPKQVLERMKSYLSQKTLGNQDQAWLVIDRDAWTEDDIKQLHQWTKEAANYHLALSNPNFEFWLLLHFEDGSKASHPKKCRQRLRKHLPNYDKHIDKNKFTPDCVANAIQHAKQKVGAKVAWPAKPGQTTVYRLIEALQHFEK